MLIFSVIRIFFMEEFDTITGMVISIYSIIFAIIFILVEFNVKKSRMWFYFLNGSLGKGIFHLFLFFLCYGHGDNSDPTWVDILLSVIYMITAILFIVLYVFTRNEEASYI